MNRTGAKPIVAECSCQQCCWRWGSLQEGQGGDASESGEWEEEVSRLVAA